MVSQRPVTSIMNSSVAAPQRNDSRTFTTVRTAITGPKPNGDMNNCSRVPHWASRVMPQERPP
jgi:hypothetical protein